MLDKKIIIEQLLMKLEWDLAQARVSAKVAHEAAVHEESKAEDQYDTRAIEASYLAGAQAGRAADIDQLIAYFKNLTLKTFGAQDPIDLSALVETECSGRRSLYFLVNHGGGIVMKLDQSTVNLITPSAPLGEALIGKKIGDLAEIESPQGIREYAIISVK